MADSYIPIASHEDMSLVQNRFTVNGATFTCSVVIEGEDGKRHLVNAFHTLSQAEDFLTMFEPQDED